MRVACAVISRNLDCPGFPQLKPCLPCKPCLRQYADGEHYRVAGQFPSRVQDNLIPGNGLNTIPHGQFHTLVIEFLLQDLGHIIIKRRHDLVRCFCHSHMFPGCLQVFSHLKPDETSADYNHIADFLPGHVLVQLCDVIHIAHRKHVRKGYSLD